MNKFDFDNKRSLASVILWQYENAENLQKLIWHSVKRLSQDGTYSDVQNGILQSVLDLVGGGFDDFYRFVFSALSEAEKYQNTMETDRPEDKDLQRLYFGLIIWSRLTGVTRPQYNAGSDNNPDWKNVHLLAWARYMRAEIMKVFSRGTCFDINNYLRTILPHFNAYVIDGGNGQGSEYMTQSFRFRPDFIYEGVVHYGKPTTESSGFLDDYEVAYEIDTEIGTTGSAGNKFLSVKVNGTDLEQDTSSPSQRWWSTNYTWEIDSSTGLYSLTVREDGTSSTSVTRTPTAYYDSEGNPQISEDGSHFVNVLLGAPNITGMMRLQYVDEYDLVMADYGTIVVTNAGNTTTTYHVSKIFPHPAGVFSSPGLNNENLRFGNISECIGLQNASGTGQKMAVLNHGIIYE